MGNEGYCVIADKTGMSNIIFSVAHRSLRKWYVQIFHIYHQTIFSLCIISLSNLDGIIMQICGYCSREQPYHQQRCIGCERLLTGAYNHASTAKKNDGYKNRAHVS